MTSQDSVAVGKLLPRDHVSRMKPFVLVRGTEPVAGGVQFTDGRVAVQHHGGRQEMHATIDDVTRDYVGMAGLLWCSEKWEPGSGVPRRFVFLRHRDVSGFSGEGVALEGVQFADGRVMLVWLGEFRSSVQWPDIQQAISCHGHEGSTELVWLDGAG